MAEGMSKAHQRQQSKHKRTGKYVKQKERTTYNKIRHKLMNAAHYDKALYAKFLSDNGGINNVLWMAQNALNMQGYIDSLSTKYMQAKSI